MKKETTQEQNIFEIKIPENADGILRQVIEFLQLFLSSSHTASSFPAYNAWKGDFSVTGSSTTSSFVTQAVTYP